MSIATPLPPSAVKAADGGSTFLEQLHAKGSCSCSHPKRAVLCGTTADGLQGVIAMPPCKMWACPSCAANNARRWIARIIDGVNHIGGDWYFVTLTAHEWHRSTRSVANLRNGWRRLYNRMLRKFGRFDYVKVWELHKDGSTFHHHLILNAGVTHRYMKDTARSCGMGYQTDTQEVENAGQVAGYIAKYTMKNISALDRWGSDAWPKGLRRIEVSRGWVDWKPKPTDDIDWQLMESIQAAEMWRHTQERRGLKITDLTGLTNDILTTRENYRKMYLTYKHTKDTEDG